MPSPCQGAADIHSDLTHTLATRSVLCQLLCGAFPLGAPKCGPAARGYCGPQGWPLAGGRRSCPAPELRATSPASAPSLGPRTWVSLGWGEPWGREASAEGVLVACPLVAVARDTWRGHVECGRVSE